MRVRGDAPHDYLCPSNDGSPGPVDCDFCERLYSADARGYTRGWSAGYEQGQRDERERHANELDVAVAKARAEVVTVNLEGDFNYVKGYNDGLVKGDAKGRREGKRIASMRGESDG